MKRCSWVSFLLLVLIQGMLCVRLGAAEPARVPAAIVGDAKTDRVAVVIGNSAYPTGALANPKHDATAMAAALKKLGFNVELKLDASKADLDAVLKRFGSKAEKATVAAVFYAGHGVQVNGANYIVPIDAKPQNERDIKRELVKMDDVIDDMGAARVKLVFFDACRDNPLSRSFSRGGSRGMAAPVEATGTLISFATKHGNTAADGDGRHSPYTTALLAALEAPEGVEIEQMLRKVQQGVKQATNGQQEPWRYGSLDGEFFFLAAAPPVDNARLQQEAIERSVQEAMKRAAGQSAGRSSEQQARDRDTSALAVEMSYWDSIKTSSIADDFKAYVKRYPMGSFVDLAHNRVAALEREAKKSGDTSAARPAAGADQTAVEMAFWDSIKNSNSPDDLKEYLASYPRGRFAGLARNRIRSLTVVPAAARPEPATQAVPAAALPAQLAMIAPARPAPAKASDEGFPRVGDSWTYRYVDAWKKDSPQTIVVKVEEAEGGRVTDSMAMKGGRGSDERSYEGKPEAAERPMGRDIRVIELFPYAQTFLKSGTQPGQEKAFPDVAIGGQTYRIKARFIGPEKVTVAAGTFDAFSIDIVGERSGQALVTGMAIIPTLIEHRLWFVPEIRRVVKVVHRSSNAFRSRLDDETLELVSFSGSGQAPSQAIAQLAEIVPPKPAVDLIAAPPKEGDTWTYRYIDGWRKDSPKTIVVRVAESDGGRVTDRMSLKGGRSVDERTHEGRVDGVERGLGSDVRIVELLPYVQSLVQDGLKPGQEKSFPDISLGGQNYRVKARIVGQEKVTVAAGTFDALRVNITGERSGQPLGAGQQASIPTHITHVLWFAPEVRRAIKVEHRSSNPYRSSVDDDSLELISFTLR